MPAAKNSVRGVSARLAQVILDSVGGGAWRREKYDLAAKLIDAEIDAVLAEDRVKRLPSNSEKEEL